MLQDIGADMSGARVWTHVWCVVAACGVGLAMLAWSPALAVVAVLLLTFGTGLVLLVVWGATDRLRPDDRIPWRRLTPHALGGGAGLVTFFVLAGTSPPLALLCLLLCVLTTPRVLRRIGGGSAPRPSRPAPPVREEVAGTVLPPDPRYSLAELDDDALCRLWRYTYWQLDLQTTEAGVLELVALRQACLDELERRDPSALRAWLFSGARASGGAERFWPHGGDSGGTDAA